MSAALGKGRVKACKHENATQARANLGLENWNKYFKFSIIRNPWDQAISMYFHLRKPLYETKCSHKLLNPVNACGVACNSSFLDYCRVVIRDEQPQEEEVRASCPLNFFATFHDWFFDEDENLMVDYVGRFENLQEEVNTISDKIGVPQRQLRHKNPSKHKHYTEYYDEESRQVVAEKYAKDIEYFGYEFGE